MKKGSVITAVVLLCVSLLPLAAMAEEMDTQLNGLIVEVGNNSFLMNDVDIGEVQVNMDIDTVLDGTLAEMNLVPGMYVFVTYDGTLTRSHPPQAYALRVGCYTLQGTVSDFLELGFLLTGDRLFGDVIVRVEEDAAHIFSGMYITVYYNGAMAMSLPPQVFAWHYVVPVMKGTLSTVQDDSLTVMSQDGTKYTVEMTGDTLRPEGWDAGDAQGQAVAVYYAGSATEEDSRTLRAFEIVLFGPDPAAGQEPEVLLPEMDGEEEQDGQPEGEEPLVEETEADAPLQPDVPAGENPVQGDEPSPGSERETTDRQPPGGNREKQ